MNLLLQQFRREWQLLLSDRWLCAFVSWVPPLLFLLLWSIFSAGIPRGLTVGVVDLDNSKLSRNLIRHYDSHPGLRVRKHFSDASLGSAAMRNAEINALIVIPYEFEKGVVTGKSPQITVFYNSQFLLTGNLVSSAIQQAQGAFDVKLEVVKAMVNGEVRDQALGVALPLTSQITPLFNVNTNYAHFLVSAIIPATWQILIVLVCILALSRETRLQGVAIWLGKQPLISIAGKFLPYTIILWLHGMIFLWFMFGALGWPMNGNWGVLILGQFLAVLASQGVALLLFLLVRDPARTLSMAAAYTAPGFAFMGVTFPATDMTTVAQVWRNLLPVSHYIDIQLDQANHGASVEHALPQLGELLLFLVTFLMAYKLAIRIRRQAQPG